MGNEEHKTHNRVRIGILIASVVFGLAWGIIMILIGKN